MDIKEFLKNKQITPLESMQFNNNVLFHGIKPINLAKVLNKDGCLEARTTQRYWQDGRYLQDDHPDYEKSGWLYGWSTSRDKFLAGTFGGALLVLNKETLKQNFKIRPLSWSYRLAQGSGYYKKEREDFIISHKQPLPLGRKGMEYFHNYIDSLDFEDYPDYLKDVPKDDNMFSRFHRLHKTNPKTLDLNKHLMSFYLSSEIFDIYNEDKEDENYKLLINHPLFRGFYSDDENIKKFKKSISKVYMKR